MGSEGILQFGMKGKKSTEKIKFGNFGGKKDRGSFEECGDLGPSQVLPNGFPQDIPGSFPVSPAAKQGLIYVLWHPKTSASPGMALLC